MTIKPTVDTTIMSTLVTVMLKLHRISGDSKDPIIAQAHNNNDNECSGLDPGPFPATASIVALPSNWTAARH